ncbi:hypothetical protein C4K03_4118 [Pseudomonas synxantha]|uniref:Uncharacterized protein n=1 Tax=Pseudomonas synxantha TaxID=47883 RepID=A0A3G7UCB8_9PSED|nr:hypothetical protein C4K03_4118 [Pseudomonas synxantha]
MALSAQEKAIERQMCTAQGMRNYVRYFLVTRNATAPANTQIFMIVLDGLSDIFTKTIIVYPLQILQPCITHRSASDRPTLWWKLH